MQFTERLNALMRYAFKSIEYDVTLAENLLVADKVTTAEVQLF